MHEQGKIVGEQIWWFVPSSSYELFIIPQLKWWEIYRQFDNILMEYFGHTNSANSLTVVGTFCGEGGGHSPPLVRNTHFPCFSCPTYYGSWGWRPTKMFKIAQRFSSSPIHSSQSRVCENWTGLYSLEAGKNAKIRVFLQYFKDFLKLEYT